MIIIVLSIYRRPSHMFFFFLATSSNMFVCFWDSTVFFNYKMSGLWRITSSDRQQHALVTGGNITASSLLVERHRHVSPALVVVSALRARGRVFRFSSRVVHLAASEISWKAFGRLLEHKTCIATHVSSKSISRPTAGCILKGRFGLDSTADDGQSVWRGFFFQRRRVGETSLELANLHRPAAHGPRPARVYKRCTSNHGRTQHDGALQAIQKCPRIGE